MPKKTIKLDWGCYKVYVEYDPANLSDFQVFYCDPNFANDHTPYRKLTGPEKRAALEAIYRNEKMPIPSREEQPSPKLKDFTLRDAFARDAMAAFINRAVVRGFSMAKMKVIAEESYTMADAMMEVRDPPPPTCKSCGKEI